MTETAHLTARISVGTHYRVWWFWLPIIFGGLSLFLSAALMPLFPRAGMTLGSAAVVCFLLAVVAGIVIERGRRWVEITDNGFRYFDRSVPTVIADEQVTDLALHRRPHHGAGKLLAETRCLVVWITTDDGPQRLNLISRMAPGSADPVQPLINRLCRRLGEQAVDRLAASETVDGDGWVLDAKQLHVSLGRQQANLLLHDLSAVERIGQEVRLWEHDNPYTVARLPITGRNGWLLERLLVQRVAPRRNGQTAVPHPRELVLNEPAVRQATPSPLGRILFERSPGNGPTVVFGVMGLLLGLVGGLSLWAGVQARDPLMSAIGGVVTVLSVLCFLGGARVRRVRFRCYEHGLERISMTVRKVLPFDDIDVFSFERRRNQSHGRYTGTTYTLIFADRSREQGRGIFYSTTIRNHDEELDDLRERVSQIIACRMAQTFAAHRSVQWTPEVWFRRDALEYQRPRRMFVAAKSALIPYDTITDFELRDSVLHIWTSYQQRAVLSMNAGSPNFYPGLIVLEGLARTWNHRPLESVGQAPA